MTFERIKKVFIASWVFLKSNFQFLKSAAPIICLGFLFRICIVQPSHVTYWLSSKIWYKNRCQVIQEFKSHNLIRPNSGRNVKSADFNYWTYVFEGYKKYKEKKEKYVVSNFVLESKVTFLRFIKSSVSFPYPNCQSESRVKHRRA